MGYFFYQMLKKVFNSAYWKNYFAKLCTNRPICLTIMTLSIFVGNNGTKEEHSKRNLLLNAALDVFSTYGFNGASLDEIAQLADMHKSNIFYYYENKEALYVEVLTTVLQKWLAPLQSLEVGLEPAEALANYLMLKIEVSRHQPKASKLFALEVIQGAPHILSILKGPLKNYLSVRPK